MFKEYSIKDLILKPIVLKLSKAEEILRQEIMDFIIKEHKPYAIKPENEALIKELEARNILMLNENNEVTSIYPVSALPTNKKVVFDDGKYAYAMCAIDAIGFHYAFLKPVTIESSCQSCDDMIKIRLENGKISVIEGAQDIHILHADLGKKEQWACCCCNIMHFFNCNKHLNEWVKEQGIEDKVFSVDLELANKIAWLLFAK